MNRLVDKGLVLVLCCLPLMLQSITATVVIALLLAVCATALVEVPRLPEALRLICPLVYCALVMIFPPFLLFLPLAAGDLGRLPQLPLRFAWLVSLFVVAILQGVSVIIIYLLIIGGLSCLLAWRDLTLSRALEVSRLRRDELATQQRRLEARNRDLNERQELELRLATLSERSRIAREIHDNTGHLLTRSVLQIEALQVIHGSDEQLSDELTKISATLHTAFDTMRESVHDLYEESFDLRTQLEALVSDDGALAVELDYRGENLPPQISRAFLAIVREALSNTERHSDARAAKVVVAEFPGLWQLTVQDNGSKTAKSERSAGIGLTSMEERARVLGGVFRTSYDGGFRVFVSIPKDCERVEDTSCAS